MTFLTLLKSSVVDHIQTAVGSSRRKKYLFDPALQARRNMNILMLSI